MAFFNGLFCYKSTVESHESTAVSDDILCQACYVFDIMNNVGKCNACVHYIMGQPSSALHQ